MEKRTPKKETPRERLVAEIDRDLVERLRVDRVRSRRSVAHIVEEILARHYDVEPPVVTG